MPIATPMARRSHPTLRGRVGSFVAGSSRSSRPRMYSNMKHATAATHADADHAGTCRMLSQYCPAPPPTKAPTSNSRRSHRQRTRALAFGIRNSDQAVFEVRNDQFLTHRTEGDAHRRIEDDAGNILPGDRAKQFAGHVVVANFLGARNGYPDRPLWVEGDVWF